MPPPAMAAIPRVEVAKGPAASVQEGILSAWQAKIVPLNVQGGGFDFWGMERGDGSKHSLAQNEG